MNEDPDPSEERLEFGQLFLRYLSRIRPAVAAFWSCRRWTWPRYLEMIGLGEMLAGYDRPGGAGPGYLPGPGLPARRPGRRGRMGAGRRGDRR